MFHYLIRVKMVTLSTTIPQKGLAGGDQGRANTPALRPWAYRNIVEEPHLIFLEDNGIAQNNSLTFLTLSNKNSIF